MKIIKNQLLRVFFGGALGGSLLLFSSCASGPIRSATFADEALGFDGVNGGYSPWNSGWGGPFWSDIGYTYPQFSGPNFVHGSRMRHRFRPFIPVQPPSGGPMMPVNPMRAAPMPPPPPIR